MSTLYVKAPLKKPRNRKKERIFFAGISTIGAISIIFAIYPFIVWQLSTLPKFTHKIEEVPVPQAQVLSATSTLQENVQVAKDEDGFSYFTTNYTPPPQSDRPKDFLLSVPKLEVKNAKVKVDSLNFYDSLALFPGSAMPGDVGNSFITGHSVLPQFADPKNYRAIFTKLSDLEVGDDIYADINGKTQHFIVQYAKIVDPHDVSVLLPISPNGHNLTLMSCVPPGTNLKRIVVIANLI